jgi:type IV pilus assembly protein PilA
MKSTKCSECGFVGWSDGANCKGCGAPLLQRPTNFSPAIPMPAYNPAHHYDPWNESEAGLKKGFAIFGLVLGIISFFTLGLLGVGAVAGIIVSIVAMGKVKREPWQYGGRGIAIAGLVLNITSLLTFVPVAMIAAIAIPNLYAARMAANEGSAISSMRRISSAEATYQSMFQRYGTLDELAARELIPPTLASGTKNGYKFTIELKTNVFPNSDGFELVAVPVSYQSSGRRSFYIDESMVIRAADNHGRPSTQADAPLESDYDYPGRRVQRSQYGRDADF